MAASVALAKADTVGRYVGLTTGTVTLDNSYTTGGLSLTPTSLGFSSRVEFISLAPSGGYFFEYDYTNNKVKAFNPTKALASTPSTAGPGTEVANATDLSAITLRFLAYGS